jgi:thiamine-monophosphate kinase
MSLEEIGYRAMVSNISDCAAMGAKADSALVQVTFPADNELVQKIGEMYKGFARACSRWHFPVVGGDLSKGDTWVIGITLVGKTVVPDRVLKRKGARDGDYLWLTGFPGRSGAGLEVLSRFGRAHAPNPFKKLIEWHIEPVPRIEAGLILAQDNSVHAMMDLSDGLSKDCRTLCYENALGIELSIDASLAPESMVQLSDQTGIALGEWILHGGEDYELLFAASSSFDPRTIPPEYCNGLMCIGQFTGRHNDLKIENCGRLEHVSRGSWDHL